ncbi:MAG: DUF4259 domain-containing protein [Polyangiaceae bacterium]
MGTWGTNTFQTDTALDWFGELGDVDDPLAFLEDSLTPHIAGGRLDASSAEHVICAAEVVAAVLGQPSESLHPEVLAWASAHEDLEVAELVPQAVHALRHVLADDSELNEIWLETDAHDEWRRPVAALRRRLRRSAD